MNQRQKRSRTRDHIYFVRGAETPFQRVFFFIPKDSIKLPRHPKNMEYKHIPSEFCRERLTFLNVLKNTQGRCSFLTFLPSLLLSTSRTGKKSTCKLLGCSLWIPCWNRENSRGGTSPAWSHCRFWGQRHPFPGRILWAAPGSGTSHNQGTARPQTIPVRIRSLMLPRFVGWFVGSLNPPFPQGFPLGRASGSTHGFPSSASPEPTERGPSSPSWPHPPFPWQIHGQALLAWL